VADLHRRLLTQENNRQGSQQGERLAPDVGRVDTMRAMVIPVRVRVRRSVEPAAIP
jgi:hypothetical protein